MFECVYVSSFTLGYYPICFIIYNSAVAALNL